MPLFKINCQNCAHVFYDIRFKKADINEDLICPKCESTDNLDEELMLEKEEMKGNKRFSFCCASCKCDRN